VVAGDVCPDHALAQALAGWVDGARQGGKAWLVVESAGLCDRCVPFVAGMPALLVLDLLESPRAPMKMRLALEAADLVVLTKAELVSPVERDLFQRFVRGVKPGVEVLVVNALTGEGLERLRARVLGLGDFERPPVLALRRPLPRGWCGVCQQGLGEA
jgi:Ni2+-binding GTPase involved in maturation of urease and hydrogenase